MNTKKTFLILFLMTSLGGFAQNSLDKLLSRYNSHTIPYISVQELKMLQKENSVAILDARERDEFEVSHIEDAVFVGYSQFSAEEVSHMFKDKKTPIVVYCSLGIRSENISEKLKKSGFTNVRNLYGGIFEWKNNGYSVIEMQGRKTEKVHAYSPSWGKWLKKGEKVY